MVLRGRACYACLITRRRLGWLAFAVLTAAAGVAVLVTVLGDRVSPCSEELLEDALSSYEPPPTREGFHDLDNHLLQTLDEACPVGRPFGAPRWAMRELWLTFETGDLAVPEPLSNRSPRVSLERAQQLCPEYRDDLGVTPERVFEQCGFERFGLYEPEELARVRVPPIGFFVAYDELLDSGLDEDLARRYFRLLGLSWDRTERAPDLVIVERDMLRLIDRSRRIEWGPEGIVHLDEYGRLPAEENVDALEFLFDTYTRSYQLRVSLAPDARASDLRWLTNYEFEMERATAVVLADYDRVLAPIPCCDAGVLGIPPEAKRAPSGTQRGLAAPGAVRLVRRDRGAADRRAPRLGSARPRLAPRRARLARFTRPGTGRLARASGRSPAVPPRARRPRRRAGPRAAPLAGRPAARVRLNL
jgi:hypothetical protein